MSEELKEFDINLNDIEENAYLFNTINEAVEKMRVATLKDRFEVVLNNNLIEAKDKYTGFRTILGCRISYDNLDKNVSFIVREDTKPTYEELEAQLQQKENIIKEVREYIENNTYKIEWGDLEQDNEDINISEDLTDREFIENLLEILDKENK